MARNRGEIVLLRDVDVGRRDAAGRAVRDWRIAEPWRKLVAKYERGTTLAFDHYVFNRRHGQPNRITSVDIATANALMNANAGRTGGAMGNLLAAQDVLEPLLARTAADCDLLAPDGVDRAAELVTTLITATRSGTKLAVASKLLSIKRPHLVPMLDSLVQNCLGTRNVVEALERFTRITCENRPILEALAGRIARQYGIPIGPVRVLDQLIWFDWNVRLSRTGRWIVCGFPEWSCGPADHAVRYAPTRLGSRGRP